MQSVNSRGPQRHVPVCTAPTSLPRQWGCQGLGLPTTARFRRTERPRCATVSVHSSLDSNTTDTPTQTQQESSGPASDAQDNRIAATLAGLDALLGIEEESEKAEKKTPAAKDTTSDSAPKIDIAPEVLKALADAEAARRPNGAPESKETEEQMSKRLSDQMMKIVEQAKKLAQTEDTEQDKLDSEKLRGEFETLVTLLRPEGVMDKEDIKKLKEQVFGPQTFWVTETKFTDEILDGGLLVRGNLRAPVEQVLQTVDEGVKRLFGDRFEVFLIADPESEEEDPRGGPRVAFQIIPSAIAAPKPATKWQYVVAALLAFLSIGSAVQLGFIANISQLPKETIEWLSHPENYDPDLTPPGLENFDPIPILMSALPITTSVAIVQFSHELAHRLVAWQKKIKLGPSLFIPNSQIGSFGALTQVKSLVRNYSDLFDVTAAGPVAAAIASFTMFGLGLAWSGGNVPQEGLVPVPTQLFQGSLLLGSVAKLFLGDNLGQSSSVLIHPLLIGGWCGLVSTALNLLPVGAIDGGKMVQAAYGRSVLGITSFFTYVGLGLGFLGSSLALPFGLYVLICQRNPERHIQDQVTQAQSYRQTLTTVAVILSILILLPAVPGLQDTAATGGGGISL